ncbi:MAG: PH domain-containing protein [Hyphomicrobiales bacterium]
MHPRTASRHQLAPVAFRPPRALGVIVGGAFVAWALIAAGFVINIALDGRTELKTLIAWVAAAVLLLLALAFANWTYAVASLAYEIEEDALVIRWGFRRVIVPIASIQRMVPGRTIDVAAIEGLNWWGCHIGSADVKRIGYTMFYSTHSEPSELLYVVTSEASYALTLIDQAAFAEEIQARAIVGAVERTPQRSVATGVAALPFWRDRVALVATGLSAAACVVLCAYVFVRYPGLPEVTQLNFPALGGVIRIGDKTELLRIAYLGVGILAVNTSLGVVVHARERAAGLWLLASSGILQTVLLAAAVVAFNRA